MLEYLQVSSDNLLPPINANSFAVAIGVIVVFKAVMSWIAKRVFQITEPSRIHKDELEYSYYFHLALVILVMPDIHWNVFDLAVWIFSYVVVGIMRNILKHVQDRRNSMLESIVVDRQLVGYLRSSRRLSACFLAFSVGYMLFANWYFIHVRFRLNQILLYPTLLLLLDSLAMLVGSSRISSRLHYYLNNNIDDVSPVYWVDALYTFAKSTLKVWHFSAFLRAFYRASSNILEVFISPWIITVLSEFYVASKNIGQCVTEYSRFRELMQRISQYLPRCPPSFDEMCVICQQELLGCRKVMQCGHRFHFKCIFLWIKAKTTTPDCPVCRKDILPKGKRPHLSGYARLEAQFN